MISADVKADVKREGIKWCLYLMIVSKKDVQNFMGQNLLGMAEIIYSQSLISCTQLYNIW